MDVMILESRSQPAGGGGSTRARAEAPICGSRRSRVRAQCTRALPSARRAARRAFEDALYDTRTGIIIALTHIVYTWAT